MERLRLPEVTPAPLLALAVSNDEPRRILAVVDFLTVVPIVFATVMLLLTSAIAVLTAVIYIFQEEINGVPMAKQELKFIWGWIHGHVVSGEFLPVDLAARWFARCAYFWFASLTFSGATSALALAITRLRLPAYGERLVDSLFTRIFSAPAPPMTGPVTFARYDVARAWWLKALAVRFALFHSLIYEDDRVLDDVASWLLGGVS